MTERELKKMSRADLLELLVEQGRELENVKQQLAETQENLAKRQIVMEKAGSIAEASLAINGVFLSAQAAADEYLANIKALNERQDEIIAAREKLSREKTDSLLAETEEKCSRLEEETKLRCDAREKETAERCAKMEEDARVNSEAWWKNVQGNLKVMYESQSELRNLMSSIGYKTNVSESLSETEERKGQL